ncbi:hypothetical protein M1O12_04225 [Dehalococcoidia bacterium]|nr:hypothetical protein [Dehalococcoidia bacterium]
MDMINARDRIVNEDKVETQFSGKNLTTVGGIGLFHKFARKLRVEEKLELSIRLPEREGKYTEGRRYLSLIYALVLDLSCLSDTVLLRVDKALQKMVGLATFPTRAPYASCLIWEY